MLLDTGKVDVDAKDKYGLTLISRAAGNGYDAVVKMLLSMSGDPFSPQAQKPGSDWFAIFNPSPDVDLVHTLTHESVVCCLRIMLDGKYLATGCNRSAQIYDVHKGEKLCVLQDDSVDVSGDLYVRSVCFSPDGKYLATSAEDKLIRIWDIRKRLGKMIPTKIYSYSSL